MMSADLLSHSARLHCCDFFTLIVPARDHLVDERMKASRVKSRSKRRGNSLKDSLHGMPAVEIESFSEPSNDPSLILLLNSRREQGERERKRERERGHKVEQAPLQF